MIDSAGVPLSEIPKLVSFSSVEHEIFVTSVDAESLVALASPGKECCRGQRINTKRRQISGC